MTKFNKFKKMCELIIELAELATIEGVDGQEAMSIRSHMEALCPDDYVKVRDTLFPQSYYPYTYPTYGQDLFNNSWNPSQNLGQYMPHYTAPYSAWTNDSPVRPVTANTKLDEMINGIKDETDTVADASAFVKAVSQLLPKGNLKQEFGIRGEIINAVRDKQYNNAVNFIKDNWVEGESDATANDMFSNLINTAGNVDITNRKEVPTEDNITD